MADGRNITVSTALGEKLVFSQMEGSTKSASVSATNLG
jgi:hypothetical protein